MNEPLVVVSNNAKKGKSRRRQRGLRQPKKKAGKTTVIQVAARRPRRRRARGARLNGDGVVGVGSTRGQSGGKNSMTVSQSEYIQDIKTVNFPNFELVQLPINPGMALTFPWLSTIAARFEKYSFSRLRFIYKKTVSEFATAGQAGKVIMSMDFDASDPPPTTKQQMEDTIPHADAMPSQTFALDVPRKYLQRIGDAPKYIRAGGIPGSSDIKMYDIGTFNIAAQGGAANGTLGELHVAYTVHLEKPVLEGNGPTLNRTVMIQSSPNGQSLTSTVLANLVLPISNTNGVGGAMSVGNTTLTLPAGNYLLDYDVWIITAGGVLTNLTTGVLKNGVALLEASDFTCLAAAGVSNYQITGPPWYIQSASTDTYVFQVNATFTGTATCGGGFRIVAI